MIASFWSLMRVDVLNRKKRDTRLGSPTDPAISGHSVRAADGRSAPTGAPACGVSRPRVTLSGIRVSWGIMADELMQRSDRTEHATYQYLRLGMLGALATLAVSLLIEIGQTGWCAQTSISAYYFTEVKAVFVGTLLVLGVGMVVISGRLVVEDAALNLGGLLAPIVAFAPTTELNSCGISDDLAEALAPAATGSLTAAQLDRGERKLAEAFTDGSVANKVWAYLVVVAVAVALAGVVLWRTNARRTYTVAWLLSAAWVVVVAYTFIRHDDVFTRWAHLVSAVSLFVCIFIVVCANAADVAGRRYVDELKRLHRWPRLRRHALYATGNLYGVVGAAMAAGVLGIVAWKLFFGFDHWFLWIEIVLIVLFALFWLVQTLERHHDHDHPAPQPRDTEPSALSAADPAGSTAPLGDTTDGPVAAGAQGRHEPTSRRSTNVVGRSKATPARRHWSPRSGPTADTLMPRWPM